MLTEGNFTRDVWNHLLRLFNTSHFSLIYYSQNFSLTSCTEAMAKRIQEQKGEEKIVAKSKPALNLASLVSANSSTVQSPITSKSPETLKAPCQNDWTSTGRRGAREFVAKDSKSTRRLVASGNPDTKGKDNIWPHNVHISTDCVPHMEKVFSIVKRRHGLSPRDRIENSRSERSYLGIFMSRNHKTGIILSLLLDRL